MSKNIAILIIVLLLAVIGYLLLHGPVTPPPPPVLQGPAGPDRPPPGGHKGRPDEAPDPGPGLPPALRTKRGLVMGYRHNAHLDINAIELRTKGDGDITVDFRPHTAKTVMQYAPVGDSVELTIDTHPNDEFIVYQLHRIKNLRTGQSADLTALPPPPDIPPGYTAENFTLQHPELLTDPYGGIDALRSGRLLFHFKPGLVEDISSLIKTAQTITLTAVRRSDQFGFVNTNQDKVYIVLSVTIDQKTFLVR